MTARQFVASVLLLSACGGKPPSSGAAMKTSVVTPVNVTAPTSSLGGATSKVTFAVFADVTQSLTDEEQRSVIDDVQKVVDVLPPNAHLLVFPILEDVERARSIFDGKLLDEQSTRDAVAGDVARAAWRKQISEKLAALFNGPPHGRNRTCISSALRKAEEITTDTAGHVEIVLVSDMLEDCNDSLLRGPLKLQKTSIAEELKAARELPPESLLTLNGASITAILPTVPTSGQKVARPAVHELKAFWRAVLDRCGDRPSDYRLGTGVPQRLLDYKKLDDGMI